LQLVEQQSAAPLQVSPSTLHDPPASVPQVPLVQVALQQSPLPEHEAPVAPQLVLAHEPLTQLPSAH
jgi:hypothetical protein